MASPDPRFPRQTHYINNKPHVSQNATYFHTINPTTTLPLAEVPEATPEDIDHALSAASAAFPIWSAMAPVERSRILLRAVSILRERNDEIARVETLDTGKAYCETSTVDVATGADVLEYFAGLGMGMGEGKTIRLRPDACVYTHKEPLGVCVGIGAWNYPIQIALWKCAPALAAGNTFIFKPSEVTPLTANILAEIFGTAGLPAGVFNIVHGHSGVGAALVSSPRVAKVSFTGQPSTGISVYTSAAQTLKPATLELGGKSAFIVLRSADLARAVDACLTANFFSTGQVCTSGTRVFVHDAIHDAFLAQLQQKIRSAIRAGDPSAPSTNFGPLVSSAHREKVRSYIRHGLHTDRATLLCGGLENPTPLPGYFLPPTVFVNCRDDMLIVREEIFGPVACVLRFSTVEEVVARANASRLALAAGVFGAGVAECDAVVRAIRAGICWVNTWGESPAQMPVGGWGLSGLGVENGKEALAAFVKNKSVLVENGDLVPAFVAKL